MLSRDRVTKVQGKDLRVEKNERIKERETDRSQGDVNTNIKNLRYRVY